MFRIFKQYISVRQALFIVGEGLIIFFSVALASYYVLGRDMGFLPTLDVIWAQVLVISVVAQVSFYFNDLYEFNSNDTALELGSRLVQAIGISSIILAVLYYLFPQLIIGKWIFFLSLALLILFISSWRVIYALVIRNKLFVDKAILLGTGELAGDILKEISTRKDLSYDVRLIISENEKLPPGKNNYPIPIHFGFGEICELAQSERVKSIIVALDEKRGVLPYEQLLECKVRGINIVDGVSFYEQITGKILVEKLNPSWLIFSDGFVKSKLRKIVKRSVDLFASSILLVITFPIVLLTAIAIKIDSRGPIIFSQERVGESGVNFVLYKFRSMRADAEKVTGPTWASENDPRVTRVGKIIRKLRIDEIPQIWNVFKGDMSFVGPRPERPYFVEHLRKKIPYYNERFSVKPGITGWAQVKYPYGASEEDALEKLKYELYYIKNMSLLMDFIVLFYTAKIVLLGRGSR